MYGKKERKKERKKGMITENQIKLDQIYRKE